MSRIIPLDPVKASPDRRQAFDEGLAKWGRMTNMKRTLLHSLPAYRALMQWYPMFEQIQGFIGERMAIVFAHSISSQSDCLICTTFMRRILIEWGEDPNELKLDDTGELLVAFGRAVSKPGSRVPAELYSKLEKKFAPEQIVDLTAFAALMVATNIINNVLEVDLDEYLYEYRDKTPSAGGKRGN
jgi:hypothetical protein